jgi:secretion/DNA translocation related CpaE-like protein
MRTFRLQRHPPAAGGTGLTPPSHVPIWTALGTPPPRAVTFLPRTYPQHAWVATCPQIRLVCWFASPGRPKVKGMVDLDHGGAPLIVTADETLLDDLLRLSAAVGVTPELVHEPGAFRGAWLSASLVLVGADAAQQIARLDPVRRTNVFVVTRDGRHPEVWRHALTVGAEDVVTLPAGEAGLRDRLADTVDGSQRAASTVAVVGGCGGAGASILAAALATIAARRGRRVLLIDGDPLGGGLDLVVGLERAEGLRWPDLAGTMGRVSALSLRSALPSVNELALMSWDRGQELTIRADIMREVIAAGQRGNDLVVVDMPRRLDPATQEALTAATTTILVLPAEVRAIAAATRVKTLIGPLCRDLRVVVRAPGVTGIDAGSVASTLGLDLFGSMKSDQAVAESVDRGFGPCRRGRGPLVALCGRVLNELGLAEVAAA